MMHTDHVRDLIAKSLKTRIMTGCALCCWQQLDRRFAGRLLYRASALSPFL